MNENETLTELVKEISERMDDLQITCYESANKPHFPRAFFLINEAHEEGLRVAITILTNHIHIVNAELGNEPFTDIYAFVRAYQQDA